MALVKVFCNDDQNAKDFFVSVNGNNAQGMLGVEIDLKDEFIAALEDAIIETEYPDGNGGTKTERKSRFVVNYMKQKATAAEPAAEAKAAKVYACEICGEEFNHHLALAGHKKTHKDQ